MFKFLFKIAIYLSIFLFVAHYLDRIWANVGVIDTSVHAIAQGGH